MLREILDLFDRRRGGDYARSRGAGGLLDRVLGGGSRRGRYADRGRFSHDDDDRREWRGRRRRDDDDDDDD